MRLSNIKIKNKLMISPIVSILAVAVVIAAGFYRYSDTLGASEKMLFIAIGAALALILLAVTAVINRSITGRIKLLEEASKKIADGDFDVVLGCNDKDEIGTLIRSFAAVKDSIESVAKEMHLLVEQNRIGNIAYKIDASGFNGEYKKLLLAVGEVDSSFVDDLKSILLCVGELGRGNFHARIPEYKGEKHKIEESLKALKNNLSNVTDAVNRLEKSCKEGNLNDRIDLSLFEGDWNMMAGNVNGLLETLIAPIRESTKVLQQVSDGNLSVRVEGDYRGDNALIKEAINVTIKEFGAYISDISETLSQMSMDNLDVEIERDYVGDFIVIKDSINEIVKKFNILISEVSSASDMVATGARQISDTSNTLHSGTLQQSSAVSQLTAIIEELFKQTQKNADNSTKANELSVSAKENAEQGNIEMKKMLDSMAEINEASTNISKVIKVIEDIAFQTNLLALNASVEAARAGEHGKGFAVVAEEVRNLSGRSQAAVQETTTLIGNTIKSVNEGMDTATNTAEALERIVDGVANVSVIIDEIEKASKEQATNIGYVSEGIKQISDVTTTNSFTAQESAAASEELSGQSELLKGAFAKMKLKKIGNSGTSIKLGESTNVSNSVPALVENYENPADIAKAPVRNIERTVSKPIERPVARPAQKPVEKPAATYSKPQVKEYSRPVAAAKPVVVEKPSDVKPVMAAPKPATAPKPVATQKSAAVPKPATAAKPTVALNTQRATQKPIMQKSLVNNTATVTKTAQTAVGGAKPMSTLPKKDAGKEVIPLGGASRQNVNYSSADVAIFDNKDFGKY